METRSFGLEFAAHCTVLQVVYRIPNTSILTFCKMLCNSLEAEILSFRGELLLLGDCNIHMDDLENTDTILFNDLLDSINLLNKVNFPSHKLQHTLDLATVDRKYSYLSKASRGHMLSDHNFIHCGLIITKPLPLTKSVHYRKLKAIDHSNFTVNLIESLNISEDGSLYDMAASYNKILSTTLDNHAPVKEKTCKITHTQPRFNDKICNEIRLRRKKEQAWNSWPTEYNFIAFYDQR